MKTGVKYLIAFLAAMLFCCIALLVLQQAHARRHAVTCNRVEITFRDSLAMVTEEDVRQYLKDDFSSMSGVRIDSIRLDMIEKGLDSKNVIKQTQAWTTDDGTLHISISQRLPAAHFVSADRQFYIDEKGFPFPAKRDCGIDLPLFKGVFPEQESAWYADILQMLTIARKHRMDEKIAYYEVDRHGDVILHPAEGKEIFIFGKPDHPASKFARMEKYYRRIAPACPETAYTSVNLKYEGQIICRK